MLSEDHAASKLRSQGASPSNKDSEAVPALTRAIDSTKMIPQTPKSARPPTQPPKSSRVNRPGVGRQTVRGQRYDIPTLLDIGLQLEAGKSMQGPSSDCAGFHDAAGSRPNNGIGSRILRERSVNHQRQSSTVSVTTDDGHESLRHPRRQPVNAPQGTLAQSHAGFARFLKEHSSPKHHRVTAGGRIVPMTLQGPAPEFKLPVTAVEAKTDAVIKGVQAERQGLSVETKPCAGNVRQGKAPSGSHSRAIPIKAPPSSHEGTHAVSNLKITTGTEGQTGLHKASITNVPRVSNQKTNIPTAIGARQSVKLGPMSFDGISISQAVPTNVGESDQFEMFSPNPQLYVPQLMEFPENVQQPLQLPYVPQAGNTFGMYQLGTTFPLNPSPQFMPVNGSIAFNPYIGHGTSSALNGGDHDTGAKSLLESAVQEHDNIANQLSNLDRYMALHTWDIDSATKKLLVEQRVELVRKLDSARVHKEHLEGLVQSSKFETPGTSQVSDHTYMINPGQAIQFPFLGAYGAFQPANNNSTFFQAGSHLQLGLNPAGLTPASNFFSNDAFGPVLPGRSMAAAPYAQFDTFNPPSQNFHLPADLNRTPAAQNWGINPDLAIQNYLNAQNAYCRTIGADMGKAKFEGRQADKMSAVPPSELDLLYHRIEEAAKRKEPLEPYFGKLSRLTAVMNAMRVDSSVGDSVQLQDGAPSSSNAREDRAQSSALMTGARLGVPLSNENAHQVPGIEDSSSCNNIGAANETSLQKTVVKGQSQMQSLSLLSNQKPKRCTCVKNRDKVGNRSRNARSGLYSESQSATLAPPNLSTSSKAPGHNPGARRVGSGASFQVSSMGILPPFDGAGDSAGQTSKPTTATTDVTPDATLIKGNDRIDMANGRKTSWFRRQMRKDPNAMEVRAFFQMLREEDRAEIRKQDLDHPPF
ncbi:hypothetical protein CPC735_015720 [Coccidioides posadasii C735 delta SOWgp]|uniref:Uncharacterized protein n=1 Tax=Coccidioides posadasii (strain C735) TaxID=222929 RepID=C5PD12_COCP7|nr:hypothetical protein CPC735_015720 [Coccidioides posadasii C735 delta SOWgp]EER24973.1 hypothetical protein CPC735_015720 [Coccidioides posadasii C735 delta SOWgp]|eukprot:XP_003067118.1 hypothetical protein CPC735_015720 [Coccidioides posadasii C735 delta SOWgp]